MVELVAQEPLRGVDIVAQRVWTRVVKGLRLSIPDISMGAMAANKLRSERFTPPLGEFRLQRPEIPEEVKGVIVSEAT